MVDPTVLKKWARRADVQVDVIDGDQVLRFGKGGVRGAREIVTGPGKPYRVPAWVAKRIAEQKRRLREVARLKRYG